MFQNVEDLLLEHGFEVSHLLLHTLMTAKGQNPLFAGCNLTAAKSALLPLMIRSVSISCWHNADIALMTNGVRSALKSRHCQDGGLPA